MRTFDIPSYFNSEAIAAIKGLRKEKDKAKKDFTPTFLDFGPIAFKIARHFGFCFGVENAIEIVYRTLSENPDKDVYLLSEMIHNPMVNADLEAQGVKFIMDTQGNQHIPWEKITSDDIVVIPAFGTTVEIENLLTSKNIPTKEYNTTCPFVEKVWKRSLSLGNEEYTIVIHGKPEHEETRATFSHSSENGQCIIVRDIEETRFLAEVITGVKTSEDFFTYFKGRFTEGFDPSTDLKAVGVVNQTTMLATETQEIADYLKNVMAAHYGKGSIKEHYADTRDTLCYATYDNQRAIYGLLEEEADLAIVVGGYNSSNTSHLVELCEEKLPSYFINNRDKLISANEISHFDFHKSSEKATTDYLPKKDKVVVSLSSGASCPDSLVEEIIDRLVSFFPEALSKKEALAHIK